MAFVQVILIRQIDTDGDWVYKKGSLLYKKLDCIGLINLAAKFYFTREAFRQTYKVATGTNSAVTNNTSWIKPFDGNAENLKVGTILYCKSGEINKHANQHEQQDYKRYRAFLVPRLASFQAFSVELDSLVVVCFHVTQVLLIKSCKYKQKRFKKRFTCLSGTCTELQEDAGP